MNVQTHGQTIHTFAFDHKLYFLEALKSTASDIHVFLHLIYILLWVDILCFETGG